MGRHPRSTVELLWQLPGRAWLEHIAEASSQMHEALAGSPLLKESGMCGPCCYPKMAKDASKALLELDAADRAISAGGHALTHDPRPMDQADDAVRKAEELLLPLADSTPTDELEWEGPTLHPDVDSVQSVETRNPQPLPSGSSALPLLPVAFCATAWLPRGAEASAGEGRPHQAASSTSWTSRQPRQGDRQAPGQLQHRRRHHGDPRCATLQAQRDGGSYCDPVPDSGRHPTLDLEPALEFLFGFPAGQPSLLLSRPPPPAAVPEAATAGGSHLLRANASLSPVAWRSVSIEEDLPSGVEW